MFLGLITYIITRAIYLQEMAQLIVGISALITGILWTLKLNSNFLSEITIQSVDTAKKWSFRVFLASIFILILMPNREDMKYIVAAGFAQVAYDTLKPDVKSLKDYLFDKIDNDHKEKVKP